MRSLRSEAFRPEIAEFPFRSDGFASKFRRIYTTRRQRLSTERLDLACFGRQPVRRSNYMPARTIRTVAGWLSGTPAAANNRIYRQASNSSSSRQTHRPTSNMAKKLLRISCSYSTIPQRGEAKLNATGLGVIAAAAAAQSQTTGQVGR